MKSRSDDDRSEPAESPAAPGVEALTYRDVQAILALVDSWPNGHVRFAKGELAVEATIDAMARGGAFSRAAARIIVRAPTVGIFRPAPSSEPGVSIREADVIGDIVAPGRTTPVPAGANGTVAETLATDGEFVEYGQALVAITAVAT